MQKRSRSFPSSPHLQIMPSSPARIGKSHMYLNGCSFTYTNGSIEKIILLNSLFLLMNPCLPVSLWRERRRWLLSVIIYILFLILCSTWCLLSHVLVLHPILSVQDPPFHSSTPRRILTPYWPGHCSLPSQPGIFHPVNFFCNVL